MLIRIDDWTSTRLTNSVWSTLISILLYGTLSLRLLSISLWILPLEFPRNCNNWLTRKFNEHRTLKVSLSSKPKYHLKLFKHLIRNLWFQFPRFYAIHRITEKLIRNLTNYWLKASKVNRPSIIPETRVEIEPVNRSPYATTVSPSSA